jgi:hypothetical protein
MSGHYRSSYWMAEGVEMIGRRWDASFEGLHLDVRRRRLLLWFMTDIRRIPVSAVVDVRSLTAADWAQRRAHVAVQRQTPSYVFESYHVEFEQESWLRAGALMRDRAAARAVPPQRGPAPIRPGARRPATYVPTQPLRQVPPTITVPQIVCEPPAPPSKDRSTSRVMRAGGGKRSVWLWIEDDKIHASLAPVDNASKRRLDSAEVASLLLADSSKAMPAIRALTGIDEDWRALSDMRGWHQPGRVVVTLSAADAAGRQRSDAVQPPASANPDGSVRTVSGGLPSLGKRRK